MLVERLHAIGIKVVSANTDGILIHAKKSRLDDIRKVYKQWEIDSGFTLEETFYKTYVRKNVNNYISVTTDGTVKAKGALFVPHGGLLKGFNMPIVALARQKYFLDGTPIEETIRNHRDIHDFCISKKIGSQFVNVQETIRYQVHMFDTLGGEVAVREKKAEEIVETTEQQKTLRFYVTTPVIADGYEMGKRLRKRKQVDGGHSYTEYVSGYYTELFNDYWEAADFSEYRIDYDYYIEQAEKEVKKIESQNCFGKQTTESEQISLFEVLTL